MSEQQSNPKDYKPDAPYSVGYEYGFDFDLDGTTIHELVCEDYDQWKAVLNAWTTGQDHPLFAAYDDGNHKMYAWRRSTLSARDQRIISGVVQSMLKRAHHNPITGHFIGGERSRSNGGW